jgi:hypothetical protein
MNIVIGFLFVVLGGLSVVDPKKAWSIRTYIGRKFFGVTYKPSKKTFQLYKYLGIVYIVIGLLLLTQL